MRTSKTYPTSAVSAAAFALALGLAPAPAVSAPPVIVVNCNSPAGSIQNAVDSASGPTTIRFLGVCDEVVTITKDDITLDGHDMGTVEGTITFDGAQRGVVQNATVTGPGSGIVADHGASVLIQDNTITANGEPGDTSSSGIGVFNGASAQVLNNDITDNAFGDGVAVFSGAFATIVGNTITGNGRPGPWFEAGIQVGRAVARGQSNTISNNGYAGIEVFNFGTYRTGSFIVTTQPDNDGPFETISDGAFETVAVDIGQMSFIDLRQVMITGDVIVGRKSMLQIRGDNRDPDKFCSQIDGVLNVNAKDAQARVQFTHVTGAINVGADALIDGASTGTGSCPNIP